MAMNSGAVLTALPVPEFQQGQSGAADAAVGKILICSAVREYNHLKSRMGSMIVKYPLIAKT